jgi:hypothetical protein
MRFASQTGSFVFSLPDCRGLGDEYFDHTGTLRRECLDFLIPLDERHLKMTIKEWEL